MERNSVSRTRSGAYGAIAAAAVFLSAAFGSLKAQAPPPPSPFTKRVEIDKTLQLLCAFEGDRLVFQSRISTGRRNSTPNGIFHVLDKQRMHYSRRYDHAPMPYSVQYSGHYFIHGFRSVPDRPASHGCVRIPLTNGNPARTFYEWVELGTPIVIIGRWR